MFVNRYQINVENFSSGSTGTYLNIPINLEYQNVDQSDIVKRVFIDVETEKSINPIIDYEKVRFTPINPNENIVKRVIYNVVLVNGSTYGSAGFNDDDIKFQKETFKQTFLNLNFYDSDNPLNQNLVSNITLFSELKSSDLNQFNGNGIVGQPLPANDISLSFVLDNSRSNTDGFSQGYFLYDYKDEVTESTPKYLYMRAAFNNAKNGKSTNLMVKQNAQPIDSLVHELYTRYKLIRTNNGFYYSIDETYQGNTGVTGTNNVTYNSSQSFSIATVNLYQILAL